MQASIGAPGGIFIYRQDDRAVSFDVEVLLKTFKITVDVKAHLIPGCEGEVEAASEKVRGFFAEDQRSVRLLSFSAFHSFTCQKSYSESTG